MMRRLRTLQDVLAPLVKLAISGTIFAGVDGRLKHSPEETSTFPSLDTFSFYIVIQSVLYGLS